MITRTKLMGIGLILASAAACATTAPPAELVNARASYERAQKGDAARQRPADLHSAKQAMDAAEHEFAEEGDSNRARDMAYVADRRAQIAEVRGHTVQTTQEQEQSAARAQANQAQQLGRANEQLAAQGQELEHERRGRAEAEKRAAQAASDLAKFASVKQESRGMVITLSGAVMFASSKSDLLPGAQVKLNSVAEALSQQDAESKLVVEGHTDSQGGVSYNQDLSQRRAQSVRDYLVSRGIAADRVSAQGYGAARPVADNASPEGRANNRRVEIVVAPAAPKRAP